MLRKDKCPICSQLKINGVSGLKPLGMSQQCPKGDSQYYSSHRANFKLHQVDLKCMEYAPYYVNNLYYKQETTFHLSPHFGQMILAGAALLH